MDEDGINDPIEWSFRVKFVTDECLRGLSMGVSSIPCRHHRLLPFHTTFTDLGVTWSALSESSRLHFLPHFSADPDEM